MALSTRSSSSTTVFGLVLSSVSRCLEPLMKHARVFDILPPDCLTTFECRRRFTDFDLS